MTIATRPTPTNLRSIRVPLTSHQLMCPAPKDNPARTERAASLSLVFLSSASVATRNPLNSPPCTVPRNPVNCRLVAAVAQLDRVPRFERGGRGFESLRPRQISHCLFRGHIHHVFASGWPPSDTGKPRAAADPVSPHPFQRRIIMKYVPATRQATCRTEKSSRGRLGNVADPKDSYVSFSRGISQTLRS